MNSTQHSSLISRRSRIAHVLSTQHSVFLSPLSFLPSLLSLILLAPLLIPSSMPHFRRVRAGPRGAGPLALRPAVAGREGRSVSYSLLMMVARTRTMTMTMTMTMTRTRTMTMTMIPKTPQSTILRSIYVHLRSLFLESLLFPLSSHIPHFSTHYSTQLNSTLISHF
jgi:hypothetical protein